MDQNQQPSGKNRRAFIRRVPKRKAKICCYKGAMDMGPNLAVSLLDLSESGARLILKSSLEKGQEVTLTLEGMTHSRPLKALGNIIWAVATQDGNCCVGIQLGKYLPYQEIAKLV